MSIFAAGMLVSLLAYASAPAGAQPRLPAWRATEVWRVDGTESGEPFFDLRDFLIGKDGTLWVLDFNDQRIRRFDASGRELKSVSRKGSGPGELRNANGMLLRRDGSVWVNDPSNRRLSQFGADGKFVKQYPAPGGGFDYRWDAWLDQSTGDLIDEFLHLRPDGSAPMEWRRWSTNGAIRDSFPMPTCFAGPVVEPAVYRAETKGKGGLGGSYPFSTGGGQAPNGRGGVWCASPTSTTVALVRIGRNDTLTQTRTPLPAMMVSPAERQETIAEIRKAVAKYAVNDFDPAKVAARKSAIESLAVDDDGRLWIRHATVFRDTTVTLDVHDATGKHLARLVIPQRPVVAVVANTGTRQ